MSHGPRDMTDLEAEAVASCFRGSCKAMTFDTSTRLVFLQSSGHGGEVGSEAAFVPEVLNKVPVVFPYGFLSLAPGGPKVETELLETAAGVLCVAVRCALPSGIPTPAAGDSLQFSSGGSYTHHDADGDTVIEPKSGSTVKLGSDATDFVALAAKVLTELGKIETAFNAHTHPISVPCTVDPITHAGTAVGTSAAGPSYTKASVAATKAKAK